MDSENGTERKSEQAFLEKITHGFVETVESDGAFRLFRVPCSLLPKLGPRVNVRSYHAAGSELRFRMGDSPVRFTIRRINESKHPVFTDQTAVIIGIFHGDFQFDWFSLNEGDNRIEIKPFHDQNGNLARMRWRFSPELTRIILPPFVELRIVDWEGEMEPPRPEDCPKKQLLSYGSSITQGAYALCGDATYPAIAARELGVDVCNLGFGGGAALEPEIAEWIVSRTDWHLATLELGINLIHITPDEFRERVRKFLVPFASDPLKRPVFSLDMLPFSGEFDGDPGTVEKASAFRRIVREETASAGRPGMSMLEYKSLLPHAADFSTDRLHPSSHAFAAIGHGIAEQIRKQNLSILK